MATNPVNLTNVKVNISKKSYEFTFDANVNGTLLVATETNSTTVSIAANADKVVPFNAPASSLSGTIANGTEVMLNWKIKRTKKGTTDSKTYDKIVNVPMGRPMAPYSVELGQIGNITFSADAISAAEQKKKDEAARLERERIAEQQRQEEERRRQEAEAAAQAQAEAERLERERAEEQRKRDEWLNEKVGLLLKEEEEEMAQLNKDFEYARTQLDAQHEYVKTVIEEEREALLARDTRSPLQRTFPPLNPELRIAKLFQEPLVEDDPVFAAICASPSNNSSISNTNNNPNNNNNNTASNTAPNFYSSANSTPPPATNSKPDDIYSQTTISPDPYGNNRKPSSSPNRNHHQSNNNNNRNASVSPPNNQRFFTSRLTPLDILHDKNSDPDRLSHENNKNQNNKFGASTFEDDFSQNNTNKARDPDFDETLLDDPAYQPPEKYYRMAADRMQNPLRQLGTSGAEDLPPLETLHQYYASRQQQQQQQNENNNNQQESSSATSPRRNVTFSDQPAATSSSTSELKTNMSNDFFMNASNNSRPRRSSLANNKENANSGKNNQQQQMSEKEARFEMDLEPPPALMTALLHLSRDGGNINATIPIEHQGTLFNASPSPARGNLNNTLNNTSATTTSQSPHHHHTGENSMTPRRKLPLVYTNIGEVVSKTRRHDDRAAPSFMREKEIRLNTADPAQSYWNCFAPQKAQNLVGVRMANTVISAFEEAASVQIAAASPPRRVTGAIPSAPRNLRTSSPPKNSMRKVFDGGESSSSRAHRRW